VTPTSLTWYGLRKLGFDEESLGMTGNMLSDQVAIEALCIRIQHAEHEGGLGSFGHFKNYVDLLWNNPDSGSMKRCVWNPWANRMFRKMLECEELSIAGCSSAGKCIDPDTPIRMFDGSIKKAKEIVAGDAVIGDDQSPRKVLEVHNGYGPMYQVTPSNGDPWKCTDNHIHVLAVEERLKDGWWEGQITSKDLHDRHVMKWFSKANLIRRKPDGSTELVPFSIEPCGDGDWVGFSVDGNHRFLLGDYTVTHNSDPAALYGVVRYSIDPTHTLVLMMSTTIQGAKKRVWKTLREYWDSVNGLPGKALWSSNEIRGLNYRGDGYGNSSGIYLLAGDQSNEKAARDKIIGIKSPRTGAPENTYDALIARPEYADLRKHFDEETLRELVPRLHNLSQDRLGKLILIIDEMTGVSESILNAVNTNLKPGNVGSFQIIGLGNPNLPYDPFGLFSKPKGGWDKVDLLRDDEWETATGGTCIRFNAEDNPRIVENNERYSWMLRLEDIEEMARRYGKQSLFYHRMVLGTWCLNGEESGVYSPADIEMSGAKDKEVVWGYEPPTPVSFLDPSFTAGGDLAWATFGVIGTDFEGKRVLMLIDDVTIKTDPTNTTVPINYQVVKAWKKECEDRGVKPQHAAYDRSGGGIPFGDIVSVVWSPLVSGVTSGGTASRRPVQGEKTPEGRPVLGCEKFANKSTEIWYSAHPLFRSHQIKGVSDDLAKELCSRQHAEGKTGDGRKLCIENKRTYKDREGSSPDQADSFLGLVDFCRDKMKLEAVEGALIRSLRDKESAHGNDAWKAFRDRARRLTKPRNMGKE